MHFWNTQIFKNWLVFVRVGIESFSKLGDSIYFQERDKYPSLYIIQFISSTLNWDIAGLTIKQTVNSLSSWDPYLHISLEFFTIKVVYNFIVYYNVNLTLAITLLRKLKSIKVQEKEEQLCKFSQQYCCIWK